MKYKKLLALTLSAVFLAACGGGATPPPIGATTVLKLSGTAATGKAIAGAIVMAKCQFGGGNATTLADGTYSLVVAGGQLPCMLQITNPEDNTTLHTVASGAGSTSGANITPLTEMLAARVLRAEPAVFFAAFDAAIATSTFTVVALKAAQADVGAVLAGTVDTSSLGDFITATLNAATPDNPTGGDSQDKILDALRVKINAAQLPQVVTALTKTTDTAAIQQVVANLVAESPTANAGAAQSVVAGTTVTLDGSASAVSPRPVGRNNWVGTPVAIGDVSLDGSAFAAYFSPTLTYAWTLTIKPAGSAATLASPTSAKPTFTPDVAGTYVASLVVNDGAVSSGAAAVSITASVANAAPVANADVAPNVVAGGVVTLDASASSDANGDTLTYAWTLTAQPTDSTATLSSPTSAKPTFIANAAGVYVASLVVNDGKVNSAPTTTSIVISDPKKMGVAYVARNGMTVTLISFATTDLGNGYSRHTATYKEENNTSKAIDQWPLMLYFTNTSPAPQYATFGTVLPGAAYATVGLHQLGEFGFSGLLFPAAFATVRSYTFDVLTTSNLWLLQYDANNFFTAKPVAGALQWVFPIH